MAININKKSKKVLLSLLGVSLISSPIFALISCTNPNKNKDVENKDANNNADANNQGFKIDPNLKYPDSEFEKDVNSILKSSSNLEDIFELTFQTFLGGNDKKNVFASQIQSMPSILKIKAKNTELNKKIHFEVQSAILEDNANRTGKAKINVAFINKATGKRDNKIYDLSGLNTSFDNKDLNGNTPNNNISPQRSKNEILEYIGLSQEKRFEKDNTEYLNGLKNYLAFAAGVKNWNDLRKTLEANEQKIKEFNEKAAKIGQDSFENSAFKGFTLPSYKNGNFDGLDILEGEEIGKQPSWVDSLGKHDIYKTIGLARKIVNEDYLKIAKQTYSIRLSRLQDYKEDIAKIKLDIEYFKKPENKDEYNKLNNERIEELKKDRKKIEAERDEEIKKNTDPHLKESLENKKKNQLKDYDEKIQYYYKLDVNGYIKVLQQKINELEEKAKEKNVYIPENGTMWILDYQLEDNGKYPTKWYFGTNSHVAKAITENLSTFSLTKVNNDVKVGSSLKLSQLDDNITTFGFSSSQNVIKKVFDGVDFLKQNASHYLSSKLKEKYKDLGSFADFAVIEIDFNNLSEVQLSAFSNNKDVKNKYISKINDNNFSQEIAREITNNYANESNQHIKFRKNSYLKEYNKINYPLKGKIEDLDSLYAVGWPSSKGDFYLKQYIDDDQKQVVDQGFSLWTNTEYEYYDRNVVGGEGAIVSKEEEEKFKRGNFLSYQIGYRSFKNMPGILDIFISSPKTGKNFYSLDGKWYANMGLGYIPRRWAPIGGASGSSIRNQNNELVAVYYATNTNARAGLSLAFRSEGFDYEGLYGDKYKLPQYDLIYGGGKDQKNSYREALSVLYKSQNIKTNLFNKGLSQEYDEFKFNNSSHLKASDLKINN